MRRGLWIGRVAIGLFAIAAAALTGFGVTDLQAVDEMLRDRFVRQDSIADTEDRVVVVDIDEASLAAIGPWPWPRSRLADLAEILLGPLRARAVGLDMVLPESGGLDGDARLAALARFAPLTLAVALDYVDRHPSLAVGRAEAGLPIPDTGPTVASTGFVGNAPTLGNPRCLGNIGFVPDADGAIRRLPLFSRLDTRVFLPLGFAMLSCAGGASPSDWGGLADEAGFWRIPFRRALSAYTVVPASKVLGEEVPAELFANRYVLIGSSALGLADRVATPLGPTVSGVFVHAAVLSSLLDAASGTAPRPWPGRTLVVLWSIATILGMMFLLPRLAPLWSLLILLACALAWLVVARLAVAAGTELSILAPWFGYLILGLFALPYEWWAARRASQRMQRILSHYVAPTVVAELLKRPHERPLEPRSCNVSVLIADMESYTRITSTLSLNDAARLTCDFLGALTDPILASGGTLDKYTGDGVVAFWGAPIACTDHADRATEAACRIVEAVSEMNARHAESGLPSVRVRVGVESGPTLVGDLGTRFRSAYTAVGNCINFAAKLQEAARHLPADIVVGPGAQAAVKRTPLRSLGIHQPPGVSAPIELFTPTAVQPLRVRSGN